MTFRLPRDIQQLLLDKARREDMSFAELIRRALRREVGTARPAGPSAKDGASAARR